MTTQQWNDLSEQSRIRKLIQYQVQNSFPANRPKVVSVEIAVVAGVSDTVTIADLLKNYQLFSIVGFGAAPGRARTRGTALAAKIFSIAGGTLDELNYIDEAVLGAPGFATSKLIYSIIESTDIVITLAAGHNIEKLHFYCLPATYNVAANIPNTINF
jgi:hypothetical protein